MILKIMQFKSAKMALLGLGSSKVSFCCDETKLEIFYYIDVTFVWWRKGVEEASSVV